MRFHDTPPGTPGAERFEVEMQALVRLLRESDPADELGDVESLVAELHQDNDRSAKAASRMAPVLNKLGKSTYDVALKIISDIGSAIAKKTLGL